MNIVQKYDRAVVKEIAKNCGSENVKNTLSYLDIVSYHNVKTFKCEILDDCAFFAGWLGKKHFRLYEIAVKEDCQGKGYGVALIIRMKKLCKERNVSKITFRTSKEETAVDFFRKHGGIIIGEKGNDYEMEIYV